MQTLNNFVLLKVKQNNSEIRFKDGRVLYLDTSYNPQQHTSVVCEVVEVPEKLIVNEKHPETMPWKTEMELLPGDEVIIYYVSYHNAFSTGRWFEQDGQQHFFVNYQNIYLAKRDFTKTESEVFIKSNPGITDETMFRMNLVRNKDIISRVIMLNGYILLQPQEKKIRTNLIIPDYLKRKKDTKIVQVAYIGSYNREYILNPALHDDPIVESGDWVIVERDCDVPLEHPTHLTFFGDKEFYRIQRCLIHGIIKDRSLVA